MKSIIDLFVFQGSKGCFKGYLFLLSKEKDIAISQVYWMEREKKVYWRGMDWWLKKGVKEEGFKQRHSSMYTLINLKNIGNQ